MFLLKMNMKFMGFLTIFWIIIAIKSQHVKNRLYQFINEIHEMEIAAPQQFPWQVSITSHGKDDNSTRICSGTLISVGDSSWVITAAQCTYNYQNITLGLGSNLLNQPEVIANAEKVVIYEGFQSRSTGHLNDMALIKIKEHIDVSEKISPIILPNLDQIDLSFEGVKGISAGWGEINQTNLLLMTTRDSNETLHWQEMSVISNTECRTIFGNLIVKNTLCARILRGNTNLCETDIGSPLVLNETEGWKIIAVASYSQGCDSSKPAVFSRVTSFMNWISKETGINIPNF